MENKMNDDDYREIFQKKLLYYMDLKGKKQSDIVSDLGFSQSTVSSWCTGLKLPRMGKVQALADYFGIKKTDLLEDKPVDAITLEPGTKIPVLGRVCAGNGIIAYEDKIDEIEISEQLASTGSYYGLAIKGDSMEPLLKDADIVIVNKDADCESGDLVIAIVNGNEATCKRLQKYADGIALIPLNPTYEPLRFTKEDIDNVPVRIVGKVVESRRKF